MSNIHHCRNKVTYGLSIVFVYKRHYIELIQDFEYLPFVISRSVRQKTARALFVDRELRKHIVLYTCNILLSILLLILELTLKLKIPG